MIDMDIETAIWLAIWFFFFVKIWLPIIFPPEEQNRQSWNWWKVEKQMNNSSKINKEIDKEVYSIKTLYNQIENLEIEIDRLEIETSTDFEKEATNNNRIQKLLAKINLIKINIDQKNKNIDNLNRELQWIY